MLISGFPTVGLKIDETQIEGGSPGSILVVGPDGELAQMLPMTVGFAYPTDDGRAVRVDGSEADRHLIFLEGTRDLVLEGDQVGQETLLVVTQRGEGGHEIVWPSAIAWKNGLPPRLEDIGGRAVIIRLLKVGDREWLGWSDGHFS